MMFKYLLLFSIVVGATANAVDIKVDCNLDNVFCMDELVNLVGNEDSLETAIAKLPVHLKRNVTFKRGNNIEKKTVGIFGPHGHRVSAAASESSSAAQPRAFVWDELTGLTLTWNSGNLDHTAHDRFDIYDFDFSKNEHRLFAWLPTDKGTIHGADFPNQKGETCIQCHGNVQRPIFPMYPDWPQFYGEFNDEMTGYGKGALALRTDLREMANDFQPKDKALFLDFLMNEGASNPRYTPIFAARPNFAADNAVYPFRPRTTTSPFSDVSRAFANRPNLRIGVMYNRLTALQTFEKIKRSPVFRKFADVILYSILDCNWDVNSGKSQDERKVILGKLLNEAHKMDALKDLNLRGVQFSADEVKGNEKAFIKTVVDGKTVYFKSKNLDEAFYSQIPYEDLLRLLGLDIRDMDIRFKHNATFKVAKGYGIYDPKAYYFTDNAMDIGYVLSKYAMNSVCDNNSTPCNFSYSGTYMQGMRYFNAYFDGAATTNELLAAQMLLFLTDEKQDFSQDTELETIRKFLRNRIPDPNVYFETLAKKYSGYEERLKLDGAFFSKMDKIGPWLQLPYSPDLLNIHNREGFWGTGKKTTAIRNRHAQWLTLDDRMKGKKNLNGGQNICWNVYDSMQRLKK